MACSIGLRGHIANFPQSTELKVLCGVFISPDRGPDVLQVLLSLELIAILHPLQYVGIWTIDTQFRQVI